MKRSVYIETTVVSYLTAKPSRDLVVAGHQQVTQEWWEKSLPKFDTFISDAVLEEAAKGDKNAAALRISRLKDIPLLKVTEDVLALARFYLVNLRLPDRAAVDSLHLAVATRHRMDYLVSWNMAHIVNGRVVLRLHELNAERGMQTPVICTPEELME
jgi:hypothetical protein